MLPCAGSGCVAGLRSGWRLRCGTKGCELVEWLFGGGGGEGMCVGWDFVGGMGMEMEMGEVEVEDLVC